MTGLLTRVALDSPRAAVAIGVLITAVFATGIADLELRTGGDILRPEGHPFVVQSGDDNLRFREPRQAIVVVSSRKGGPAVASPQGFRFLKRIDSELRTLPAVRAAGVLSLARLARPVREDGYFGLRRRLDQVPDDPVRFAALLAELRSQPRTDGLLLASDGRLAAVYVPLSEDRSVGEAIGELQAWASQSINAPFAVQLTGPETAEATLGIMVLRDLAVLVPVMLAVIVTVLFVVFRNPGGVLIPMIESLVVLLWTLGAMGWLGVPVTLVTTILPVVLMTMAITDEIHLLERVEAHREQTSSGSMREAVELSLDEVGAPIVLTSITTALAFASFLSADMAPVRQFGVFTAFGILAAMSLTFVWIAPLIVLLPESWFRRRARRRWLAAGVGLGRWAARRPNLALAVGALAVTAAAGGLPALQVQDSWIANFAPSDRLVEAETRYNQSFWGSYRFDITVQGPRELFYSPDGAALVEQIEELAEKAPHTQAALSHLATLREIAEALGLSTHISSLTALEVADLATLAEMAEGRSRLREFITESDDAVRVRLFMRDADYRRADELRGYLDRHLPQLLHGFEVDYHYSGDLPAALATVHAIVGNQVSSVAWALLTVGAVLLVMTRPGGMLLCLVPVAVGVVVVLGAMGYARIPLGIATSMFAGLTVGVGVDFGIHLLHRYRLERSRGRSPDRAVEAAVETAGTAIGWDALVLAAGFLVLMFSAVRPNHSLGVLLAAAMAACSAGAMLFSPRLLRWLAALALVFPLIAPPNTTAAEPSATTATEACKRPENAEAAAIIAELEQRFRSRPLITRMQIGTVYGEKHPLHAHFKEEPYEKTLWGVFDGDSSVTRLLYVFSAPGRLAGTTLLIHDFAEPARTDGIWIYLRSFETFTKLDARSERTMVPGTALTYEDSRGFIPRDKYRFTFTELDGIKPREHEKLVLGCPASERIRENLGYGSVVVLIDTHLGLVRTIVYRDLGGKTLKRYDVVATSKLGDETLAAAVRMEHLTDGFATTLDYRYWRPSSPPPAAIYDAEIGKEKFLPRLQRLLGDGEAGGRLRKEIEAADKSVAEYEKRERERAVKTERP